jgi:hypothetical protein
MAAFTRSSTTNANRTSRPIDGRLCVADYRRIGDTMHMTHTSVPPRYMQRRPDLQDLIAA